MKKNPCNKMEGATSEKRQKGVDVYQIRIGD